MKESTLKFKVQYSDTDAYRVAWHGSYLRWMEAGRVDLLYLNGIDIKELDEKENIVMPVVEIDIKYKKSAKLLDEVTVYTKAAEVTNVYLIFEQVIKNSSDEILTTASVKGLAVGGGKILRNLKEILKVN